MDIERPLPRLVTIHTKNFVEGETIRDSRNRRVFDSLVRNGSLKAKSDMVVVSINCESTPYNEQSAEAVFVSCDCAQRDEIVFHLARDEIAEEEWLVLDGEYKFHRAVKLRCSCLENKYYYRVSINDIVYENTNALSKFYIDDASSRAKIKILPQCICDEFVLSVKKVFVTSRVNRDIPVFPYFANSSEISAKKITHCVAEISSSSDGSSVPLSEILKIEGITPNDKENLLPPVIFHEHEMSSSLEPVTVISSSNKKDFYELPEFPKFSLD